MALTKVTGHVVQPDTNIQFHNTKSTGIITATDTTQSTSTTTGALQIAGGVGIAKNLNVGGNANIAGVLTYEDVTNIESVGVATFKDDVNLNGTGVGISSAFWDKSANEFKFKDNVKLSFGDSQDLQIFHSGAHSFIKDTGTGMLKICADMLDFRNAADNATLAYAQEGNKFELFHNGNSRLETTADGITVQKGVTVSGIEGGDAQIRLNADEGDDDADRYRIVVGAGGTLSIQSYDSSFEDCITVTQNGAAKLYFNNSEKIATTNTGIDVTGGIIATGSVKFAGDVYSTSNNPWIYTSSGGSGVRAGMNLDGTNQKIDFSTAGSSNVRLRITSSGRIGIGTDSPGTRDTSGSVDIIQNHANTGPHFRVLNKHATLGGGIQFKNNNQRGGVEFLNTSGSNNGALYHSTGGWTWSETLQLASGKLLRIGKTSGSFALDVQTASDSTFRITNSGETGHGSHDAKIVAGGSYYQNPNIVGSVIKFSTYNGSSEGERARITSGGLFLLGSPTSDLSGNHKFISVGSRHAFQYGASAGTYLSFIMGSAGGDVTIDANARSGDYPPLHFNLGGSTKVAIDKDGHFGIGRSTGLELLDVKGGNDDAIKFSASAYGGGHLKITGADTDIGGTGSAYKATYRIKTKTQNSNSGNGAERDALVFYHDGWSGSTGHISVFPNSKLGIGTDNPTYQLHVETPDAAIGKFQSRRSSGSYIEYALGADGAQLGFIGSGGQILTGGADSSDFAIRSQGDLCFSSGGAAERCRIDASGRFLLGVTTQSISSSQKFEVSGMSYFSNNSTSTGTIYIRNQQDNTADVNSGAGAPFIIYTDGSGNRAGFFMNDSEQMGLSSHGSLMFYQGNTAPANPTKPRGKLDTDGMCHTGFRTVWRRNHSISTSSATYTWDDVFHEVNQADSSFMSQGGVWDLILHSDNYRHMALITASVVIGDIDTYGSSTNSWDWLTSPTTAGVWTAGCAGSPFSSVSSTSFNYTRGACHQSISMTMMKRTFRYNKGLLGTAYHQDT